MLAAAAGSAPARDWLERARHLRAEIGGGDLLAEGLSGRRSAAACSLRALRCSTAAAPDREAQLAAALAAARG